MTSDQKDSVPPEGSAPPTRGKSDKTGRGGNSSSLSRGQDLSHLHLRSDAHRVGLGYRVTFEFDGGQMNVYWVPGIPEGRDYRRIIRLGLYAKARDLFIEEVTIRLRGPVFVVGR